MTYPTSSRRHGAFAFSLLALALAGCAGSPAKNADGSDAESSPQDTKAALVDVGADIGCGIASMINKDCAKGARVGARVADKVVSWVFRSLKIADGKTVNKEYEDRKVKVSKDDVKPMAFTSEIQHADATDPRAHDRLQWARGAAGHPALGLERASTDAGFRSYWRTTATAPSRIVMDSPPGQEDVRPWLRIHDLLQAGGVRVPRVLARDEDNGFLLLEDLGATTYLHDLDDANADALLDAAVGQLLKLQAIVPPAWLPAYDEALLVRELRLFDDWFCGTHLGMTLECGEMEALDAACRHLVDAALAQPRVLVHRDFMPRNLMQAEDGPAVLDFQDAVVGPVAYDALSLFKDAFLSWDPARVQDWLRRYHARAAAAGIPVPPLQRFLRDADLIGIQRHLKVIGIFARLHHRDGKPKYLTDVPRFIGYLDEALPRHPALAPLAAFLDARVKPAMAERAARQRDAPA